jgi:digeranylgeranylglycerophospholipid reductase
MPDTHDLIIVGASFAGLVAGKRAAERGLSVLILEAKTEPGARVHTTGILVQEAAALLDIPGELVRAVPGVRLYAPSLKHTDLFSPGYRFWTTDTPEFLRWLAGQATAAGVEIRCATPFETAEAAGDSVTVNGSLKARYLLGADGAKSRVAETFGLGRNRRMLAGLEVEYTGLKGVDPRFLHTFLDRKSAPGYIGWVAPGPTVMQVGVAAKRADKPNLAAFEAKLRRLFDFTGAEIVARRSGVIPCGGVIRPVAADRVLLVGDAAGMVSPMTAGGIYTAFKHGAEVADAIADHLLADGPDPAVMAKTYPRFRTKALLRRIMDLGPPDWLMNILVGTPPMRALARLVYFHSKGLGSKSAWRDLFKGGKKPKTM